MNKIVFLLVFSSFYSSAQSLVMNEVDEFTKKRIIKVNASEGDKWKTKDGIAKGFFNHSWLSTKYIENDNGEDIVITLDTQLGGNFCVNDSGKVIFLFKNGETFEFKQVPMIKCADRIALSYYIEGMLEQKLEVLNALSKLDLEKYRIYTSDGYIDLVVKPDKTDIIKNHWGLLLTEIKIKKR